jgi:hypothetical protein
MAITSLIVVSVLALGPGSYLVRELPPLANDPAARRFEPGTRAMAISAAGAVGGSSVTDSAERNIHACRWGPDGAKADLPPLPGDIHSMVLGGNAAGDLVGVSFRIGELDVHGVRWGASGTVSTLGSMQPVDVNETGAVAGTVPAGGNPPACTRAVRRTGSTNVSLPTLGGGPSARAAAINASGWIVGCGILPDRSTTHACVWTGSGVPIDLGTLGGTSSWARDLDGQTAVGVAELADGTPHAVRWTLGPSGTPTATVDLGTAPKARTSAAEVIHPDGRIGGTSDDRAVLFEGGSVIDLNNRIPAGSGWVLNAVTALGDGGRIAGRGRFQGLPRGFLLEPNLLLGDLNGDGIVAAIDLGMLLAAWGQAGTGDLDGSGSVDGADLAILLANWTSR